ncbi:MAG: XrtA system polysaccharide chain length determinant [Candidatus Hodarchaeota archaeon]
MQPLLNSPQDYIEVAFRRKWWIIIPFIACLVLSFGYYKTLPKIYRATTLILVVPPEVPKAYISPTVSSSASERLNTLRQQILSRTRLETVIKELNLFSDTRKKMTMEEIVAVMRKAISIEVRRVSGPDTFTISYAGKEPRSVMMVANRLASLFIEENITTRERQAAGTSDFLERELSSIEAELKNKEDEIRFIKERYMGELPEQLGANLSILKRLQDQLNNVSERRKAAEEIRIMLQSQLSNISEAGSSVVDMDFHSEVVGDSPQVTELNKLKERLNQLLNVYTDKHPDVIDAKTKIARLEQEITHQQEKEMVPQEDFDSGADPQVEPPAFNPYAAQLEASINEIESEIIRLKAEKDGLEEQIMMYQRRVENTPRREQEMAELNRDISQLRDRYRSLSNKKFQAKLAENLERRQKGEQFKILDPAIIPEKPIKPSRKKILFLGAFFGLVLGCGLGYTRETMDRSFHKPEEVEQLLGFPVIAAIPRIENRKNGKKVTQPQVQRYSDRQEHDRKQISTT